MTEYYFRHKDILLATVVCDDTEINRKVRSYQPKTYVCHSFEEQFQYCIYEEMYKKLLYLYKSNFKFKNHDKYPLNPKRLEMINKLFHWNLGRMLKIVRR